MKVWMLWFEGDGCPSRQKLFREENPPSIARIKEVFIEWNETYKLDEKLKDISETGKHLGNYEACGLTLTDVE